MINDRVDAVLLDAIPAYYTLQGFYPEKLAVVSSPLNFNGLRLVTLNNSKGKKLIDAFDAGLKKMEEDHSYQEVLYSWQLVDTRAPSP